MAHLLDPKHTDPRRLKKEREKARELKATNWWKAEIGKGLCHYCQVKFKPSLLTMDHVIPLARGGVSIKGNIVPACKACNSSKKLEAPTDSLFRLIEEERLQKENAERAMHFEGELRNEVDVEPAEEEYPEDLISTGNRFPSQNPVHAAVSVNATSVKTETRVSEDSGKAWGSGETQYFFELTPDRVFECLESIAMRPTGRVTALNSFENRVYEVEFEKEDDLPFPQSHPHYRKVLKFYRPGRWSETQILEEHSFLKDLVDAEIPVIAPEEISLGNTLARTPEGILFTIFPKRGGRSPDELDEEKLIRIGRLVARIHQVGRKRKSAHRVTLDAKTYAREPLEFLLKGNFIPAEFSQSYTEKVNAIAALADQILDPSLNQRIHGDCHFGNLLWGGEGAFFLDFDDFCQGPPVQDLWLMQSARNDKNLMTMIEGYEEILAFERRTIHWIEILRALRFVHYTGWIARRYEDPAFPKAFPHFGTRQYWKEEVEDLEKQWQLIRECIQTF